jgi:hypothetical protein
MDVPVLRRSRFGPSPFIFGKGMGVRFARSKYVALSEAYTGHYASLN